MPRLLEAAGKRRHEAGEDGPGGGAMPAVMLEYGDKYTGVSV